MTQSQSTSYSNLYIQISMFFKFYSVGCDWCLRSCIWIWVPQMGRFFKMLPEAVAEEHCTKVSFWTHYNEFNDFVKLNFQKNIVLI